MKRLCRLEVLGIYTYLSFSKKEADERRNKQFLSSSSLRKFLLKIQYRAGNRPIIYFDETWFDTRKGWRDFSKKCETKAPSNKGKRKTITHAGSENGLVLKKFGLNIEFLKKYKKIALFQWTMIVIIVVK